MIQSTQISNFQSWKFVELIFDPGVNVIIGPSDSGKSSIVRAILWPASNRPSGDSFRSHWGGETTVDVEVDDKFISREKGKRNLYIISSNDLKEPVEFEAFGQNVPEEISSLLNISDINIQRQMDAPFLLSLTPGDVGRKLNQAVQLDVIDRAQKNIVKMLKQEKTLLLITQNVIVEKQEGLEGYKWLPEAEGYIIQLETTATQMLQAANLIINLDRIIDDIDIVDASLKETGLILAYNQEVDGLMTLSDGIDTQTNLWNEIDGIKCNIIENEKSIKLLSKLVEADAQVNELIIIQQDCVKLEREKEALLKLVEDIDYKDEVICVTKENMNKEQKEFEAMMPEICPLCGETK